MVKIELFERFASPEKQAQVGNHMSHKYGLRARDARIFYLKQSHSQLALTEHSRHYVCHGEYCAQNLALNLE